MLIINMRMFSMLCLFFFVLVGVNSLYLGQTEKVCGIEASSKLVHHNPWTVFVEYFSNGRLNRIRCGGTLIDSWHVITAAHCVKRSKFSKMIVRLGEYDLELKEECVEGVCTDHVVEIEVDIHEIHEHPDYNGKEHDIAILKLTKEAPYTDFIRPVCLPTGELTEDATFIAAGWGIIPRKGVYSNIKKIIPLPLVNHDTCQTAYNHFTIPETVICAGGQEGIDTCSGDSGGPLVWMKRQAELWGVTSSGNVHCGTKGFPGIYTNVRDHLDWIKSIIS